MRRDPLGALGIAGLIDAPPPTREQRDVIEAPLRPLLVVAGAGSGKTETMSMRVLWLVADQAVEPESILGLTFTRKAAAELGTRLRDRLSRLQESVPGGIPEGDPVSLTYNSFAERIVSEHGLRIGIDPDFRMLGQAGAVQMMTDIVQEWHGELVLTENPSVSTVVSRALALAGHLAEHDLDLDAARVELGRFGEELEAIGKPTSALGRALNANHDRLALLDLVGEFTARKRAAGVLDFSDQLVLATRIVRESPEAVATLREEHAAVLLDEFQDTSVIQMELLSQVFGDHPVTAVGDPNQAIYGWRGASSASLEDFLTRFQSTPAEESQTLTLSTSWRNDARILDVANRVARPLREHAVRAVSPVLEPRRGAGPGHVEVRYLLDRDAQVATVVDFVRDHRVPRGSKMTTVAVLCRRRRDFAAIDEALREADIPTQVIGLGGLLDQPAVADVRAALELSVDVTASPWLMRLLANLDLGAADLRLLWERARSLARRDSDLEHPEAVLLDAIDDPPAPLWRPHDDGPAFSEAASARVRVLGQRLRAVRAGSGRSVVEQVERAMAIMGVVQDTMADPLVNAGRESLDAFVDVAADYEAGADGATMRGFLSWLAVAEDEEQGLSAPTAEPDPHAVQIMTIHGAKGLEWDAVAVVAMDDGVFPKHSSKPRAWNEPPAPSAGWLGKADQLPHPLRGDASSLPDFVPDLDLGRTPQASFNKWASGPYAQELGEHAEREERRLAYVALTRARSALLMTGSWIDHSPTPRPPSRYLMEPLMEGLTADDPDEAIAPRPDEDTVAAVLDSQEEAIFPQPPGRSRILATDSARRVLARAAQIDEAGLDTGQVLEALAGDPLARDVAALLDERRLRGERRSMVVAPSRLPATSVSRLIEDPAGYARDLRRPLPSEPSESSALGTIFHAWVERQLRQTSGELWDEPTTGEDGLDPRDRNRLARMRDHFWDLDILSLTPVAIEEPFALELGGISVQGRIDAVFRDAEGLDTVVDWKSGYVPRAGTAPDKLRYYLTQLRLYRRAWSLRTGVAEDRIGAQVAFLAAPRVFTLEEIESMLGEPRDDVGDAVARAMDRDSQRGSRGRSSSSR